MTIKYILAVTAYFPAILSDPRAVNATEVPHFAALINTQTDLVECGGAIISRHHVLTTCNCTGWYIADVVNARFQKMAFELYEIQVGMSTHGHGQLSSSSGKVYKIRDVYYYEKCKYVWPSGYVYNIGAVEVTKPFKCTQEVRFAPPVPHFPSVVTYIIEELVNLGRPCQVAGFGGYRSMANNLNGLSHFTQQKIELISFQKCQLYEPWWLSESEKLTGVDIANGKHICARSFDLVVNSLCALEEGDPVLCDGYLIGLVSFIDLKACIDNSSKLGRPLVIARIDVAYDFYSAIAGCSKHLSRFYIVSFFVSLISQKA